MITLTQSLKAWGTDSFKEVLINEISLIPPEKLPLQQGLTHSSVALDDKLSVIILSVNSNDNYIIVKSGFFYYGVISGCNCADDPTPIDKINEYCEVELSIDKKNGETKVKLFQQ